MVYISSFIDSWHYPLLSTCHPVSLTHHRSTWWIFSPLVTQCFGMWQDKKYWSLWATPDSSTQCPVLQSKVSAASSAPLYHWCLGFIFWGFFWVLFVLFAFLFCFVSQFSTETSAGEAVNTELRFIRAERSGSCLGWKLLASRAWQLILSKPLYLFIQLLSL